MGIDFHFYMSRTYRSCRSPSNCKQNTSKVLDRQVVETGEIRQNKLCNMQEIGQEIERAIMGKLPIERLKPAPSWTYTALDLFGPFKIRDEVKIRTTGKANGIIFNCLGTRALDIDISTDYSTGTRIRHALFIMPRTRLNKAPSVGKTIFFLIRKMVHQNKMAPPSRHLHLKYCLV